MSNLAHLGNCERLELTNMSGFDHDQIHVEVDASFLTFGHQSQVADSVFRGLVSKETAMLRRWGSVTCFHSLSKLWRY